MTKKTRIDDDIRISGSQFSATIAERLPSQLSKHFDEAPNPDIEIYRTIVDRMEQGVIVYDGTRVLASNSQLSKIIDCPPELIKPGADLENYIAYGEARGDYVSGVGISLKTMRRYIAEGKDYVLERRLPDGRTIRVDNRNKGKFGVGTYTDVTEARAREQLLREREAEVLKLANTDGLTDLANRRSFDAALQRKFMEHHGSDAPNCLALILIDLDRFKLINDTHGHNAGDALLQEVSRRYSSLDVLCEMIARIGGDEFAVLVEASSKDKGEAIAEEICKLTNENIQIGAIQLNVGASVGVAFLSAEMASADEFLTAADLALYDAKENGKGTVRIYEPSLGEKATMRYVMERDLEKALVKDEFVLHYQVQRNLQTGKDVGYEALIRWHHSSHGMFSPADFIPLAEETGAIVEMGRWALVRAATDIANLDDYSRVAVNISPIHFLKSDLVADVRHALKQSGLPSHRLEIEVTEALLIDDSEGTLGVFKELRELGVGISLDDLGTGYSSLSYLTRLPFTKLKIDRSFIDRMVIDEPSRTLVNSILVLASSLNLSVTAEGVETQEQLDFLRNAKCDEAQGFFLSKPKPLSELPST